jgi:hypothetical protein
MAFHPHFEIKCHKTFFFLTHATEINKLERLAQTNRFSLVFLIFSGKMELTVFGITPLRLSPGLASGYKTGLKSLLEQTV